MSDTAPPTPTPQQDIIENIKLWVQLDNEIIKRNREIKDIKKQKAQLNGTLINIMKEKEVELININDGHIAYKKNMVKKPLNKKTLLTTLQSYFKDGGVNTEELSRFIFENREEIEKESIKRKINK